MSTEDKIEMMVTYAYTFLKTPYIWGGANFSGYDCSGFLQEVLACAKLDPKGDQSAQHLYDHFSKTWEEKLMRGSLLFFGRSKTSISHVSMALSHTFMIEAGGGDHTCTTRAMAEAKNACIRIRTIDNRSDLVATLYPREGL
jgi:cell wall-associated NlpC family hydrolase